MKTNVALTRKKKKTSQRPSKVRNNTGLHRLGLPQISREIQIQFYAVLLSAIHETWDVTFINGIRAQTALVHRAGERSRFLAEGHFVSEEAVTDVEKKGSLSSDLAHDRINCNLMRGVRCDARDGGGIRYFQFKMHNTQREMQRWYTWTQTVWLFTGGGMKKTDTANYRIID